MFCILFGGEVYLLTSWRFWFELKFALSMAVREKYSYWVAGGVLLLVLVELLVSVFTARQPATAALDVGVSTIRLIMPFLVAVLSQEIFFREFDRKYYLSSLVYSRSRGSMLASRFAAVVFLTVLALSVLAVIQVVSLSFLVGVYPQSTPVDLGVGYLITIFFIMLEMLVVCAFALLLSTFASVSSFILIGTIGFVFACRTYSPILQIVGQNSDYFEGYSQGVSLLGYLLPDFSLVDVRFITLYGRLEFIPDSVLLVILSMLFYMAVLLVLSVLLLNKKKFV